MQVREHNVMRLEGVAIDPIEIASQAEVGVVELC
jgi:hypothetical protein